MLHRISEFLLDLGNIRLNGLNQFLDGLRGAFGKLSNKKPTAEELNKQGEEARSDQESWASLLEDVSRSGIMMQQNMIDRERMTDLLNQYTLQNQMMMQRQRILLASPENSYVTYNGTGPSNEQFGQTFDWSPTTTVFRVPEAHGLSEGGPKDAASTKPRRRNLPK